MAAQPAPRITNEIDWLQTARTRLFKCCPYLASAIFSVHVIYKDDMFVPGTQIPTFAVDKFWRMYVNPACGDKWTLEEQAGALYHEISHLLRSHAERCEDGSYIPQNWNLAADCEINDSILPDGLKYPPHVVTPAKFGFKDGLLAEEYYALMEKQAQENGGGSGQGKGEGGEGSVPWVTENGQGASRPGEGKCGSCADGKEQDYEDGAPPANDPHSVSPAEAERLRRSVASEIAQASKDRGNVPAGWLRWADVVTGEKRVPWQKIFRNHVKRSLAMKGGIGEYTFRRVSRRQSSVKDIILPGQHRPLPQVALLVDTSGSMDDHTIALIVNEIKNILQATESTRIYVIACDAAIHSAGYVSTTRGLKLGGGGGTDMRLGFAHVDAMKQKPDVLVVATDTYTPWPESAPKGYKTVVVKTVENGETPQWAKAVFLDPTKGRK